MPDKRFSLVASDHKIPPLDAVNVLLVPPRVKARYCSEFNVPVPPEVYSGPLVDKPEKAMVPEDEIPVAAAMAPLVFTWNGDDVPTDNNEDGLDVPIPTLPLVVAR